MRDEYREREGARLVLPADGRKGVLKKAPKMRISGNQGKVGE